MNKQNKALTHDKYVQLALGSSAAATIILPQAITKAMPQAFTSLAPLTAQTLPYCTGVCGSCGGSCIGSIGIAALLTVIAKIKSKEGGHHNEQT